MLGAPVTVQLSNCNVENWGLGFELNMSLEALETEACGALNLLTLPGQAQLVPKVTRQRSGEDSEMGQRAGVPGTALPI